MSYQNPVSDIRPRVREKSPRLIPMSEQTPPESSVGPDPHVLPDPRV